MIVMGKKKRQVIRIIRNRKGKEGKGWFWEVKKLEKNKWKVRNHKTNEEFIARHNGLSWEVES